jgi:hypothetical protein
MPSKKKTALFASLVAAASSEARQGMLSTLDERCCHHLCKTRFQLASSPLPGGSRTLWIALKGF